MNDHSNACIDGSPERLQTAYPDARFPTVRSLVLFLQKIAKREAESFIFSGVNNLPRSYNYDDMPPDIRSDPTLLHFVQDFYERKTRCECRIRDCNSVLYGFSDIMVGTSKRKARITFKEL